VSAYIYWIGVLFWFDKILFTLLISSVALAGKEYERYCAWRQIAKAELLVILCEKYFIFVGLV